MYALDIRVFKDIQVLVHNSLKQTKHLPFTQGILERDQEEFFTLGS